MTNSHRMCFHIKGAEMGDEQLVTYHKLEILRKSWVGEACIFGAGQIGKGTAYELIKAVGFRIDFYCDNHIPPETYIRDNLRVRDIKYLYEHNKDVLVFLGVSTKYQKEILEQLKSHDVENIVALDTAVLIPQIMEEVDNADDTVKKRWHIFYDDVEFLSPLFKKRTGYEMNIENPKTFNEKIQWLKLHDRNPAYTQMVDKYAVKEWISQKIGEEYVIPTLGVYNTFDEIEFEKLPQQFVLKCTHDSGSVVICEDKDKFDKKEVSEILKSKLGINYYWLGREWPYKNVQRRIIVEKYMASSCKMVDYKFMCFHGEPKMVFTCTERFERDGLKVTFFDLDWNKLNFERYYHSSTKEIHRPQNLKLMTELAARLSDGIPFVRVDFYEIEGHVYFGEMTFSPGGGMEEFRPVEWDYTLGSWIDIDCSSIRQN